VILGKTTSASGQRPVYVFDEWVSGRAASRGTRTPSTATRAVEFRIERGGRGEPVSVAVATGQRRVGHGPGSVHGIVAA